VKTGVCISIRGLSKSFIDPREGHHVLALDNIALEVHDGEFLSIVGPSGCGKSTLLSILAGFEKPTEGEVLIDRTRHSPAMVFQEHALFPWRSVIDNVAFGPEMRGVPKSKRYEMAATYIEMVGLQRFERRYPHELSGGMRQRVALARALINDPNILLMDEPFASLDAQTKFILQQEFLRIWELTHKTIVYVTHAIDEAVSMGTRVVVFTRRPGKVKEILAVELGRDRRESDLYPIRERVWNSLKEEIPKL
jgi:NitT/TauT family transport system ATP-binding protein